MTTIFDIVSFAVSDTLEHYGKYLLGLVLFRMPIVGEQRRLWLLAVILGLLSTLMDIDPDSPDVFRNIVVNSVGLVLLIQMYGLKSLYGLMVYGTGYLIYTVIQVFFTVFVFAPHYGSADIMMKSLYGHDVLNVLAFFMAVILCFFFHKYKIGFMFIYDRIKIDWRASKIWIITLTSIGIMLVSQFADDLLPDNIIIPNYVPIILFAIVTVNLFCVFLKNRRDIKKYYEDKYDDQFPEE